MKENLADCERETRKLRREILDPKGLNAIEIGEKVRLKSQAVFALDRTSIIVWKSTGL
jgi:hypothetical protein